MNKEKGLLLVVLVGLLTLLMLLAVVFVSLSRLERTQTSSGVDGVRAKLLARSGMEFALSRLIEQPNPSDNPEDDWRYRDDPSVPLEQSLNPSYHAGEPWDDSPTNNGRFDPGSDGWSKSTQDLNGNGRYDGWSGRLQGTYEPYSDRFSMRLEDANSRIHINGGVLTTADANSNGIPDHRDAEVMRETSERAFPSPGDWSSDGPNGWLVRLLDNLEQVLTGADRPTLGMEVISRRPESGYRNLAELSAALGKTRFDRFSPYLTLHAWADSKVILPQPVNGRPFRWRDLLPAYREDGKRMFVTENDFEGTVSLPVEWKRSYLYAYKQLRLAKPELQPRAPIALNSASQPVFASVLSGLHGVYLHVWEGNLGFDGGFGFYGGEDSYPYPDRSTTDSPWFRTRLDYGSAYGTEERPWYGLPEGFDPRDPPERHGNGGKSMEMIGPLGELRRTAPIEVEQARAAAGFLKYWSGVLGNLRTWEEFDAGVALLPLWEDADRNGVLDGETYSTHNGPRKRFEMEDWNENRRLEQERFPNDARGLTPQQKDVLRAMANPNTDLNDYNPDANLWKWVDKSDLLQHTTEFSLVEGMLLRIRSAGTIGKPDPRASYMVEGTVSLYAIERHTTQADFLPKYLDGGEIREVFQGDTPPYDTVGKQTLVSYPEPQDRNWIGTYDGQIALAGIVPPTGPFETFRAEYFDSLNGKSPNPLADSSVVPDLRGPFRTELIASEGSDGGGNLFPDGAYSEKDETLKYRFREHLNPGFQSLPAGPQGTGREANLVYVSMWIKPNWFPQAATRPHMLFSLSHSGTLWGTLSREMTGNNHFSVEYNRVPTDNIPFYPAGCYFVPARNNQLKGFTYAHSTASTHGLGWSPRSLIWGAPHSFYSGGPLHPYGHTGLKGYYWMERGKWFHVGLGAHYSGNASFQSGSSISLYFNGGAAMKMEGQVGGRGGVRYGYQDGETVHPDQRSFLTLANIANAMSERHKEEENHFRFGEVAGIANMNYTADTTFGPVVIGNTSTVVAIDSVGDAISQSYMNNVSRLGRYYKEERGTFRNSFRRLEHRTLLRITWTAVPSRYDTTLPPEVITMRATTEDIEPNGNWDYILFRELNGARETAGQDPEEKSVLEEAWEDWQNNPYSTEQRLTLRPKMEASPTQIELEIWKKEPAGPDRLLARFTDPREINRVPSVEGEIYYRVVFRNRWDPQMRLNMPLNETPFLDDVTFLYLQEEGISVLDYSEK